MIENNDTNTRYLVLGIIFVLFIAVFIYFYKSDFFLYHSSFVNNLSALLVPTIALLGIYIAFQQWQIASAQKRIANNKLRLDLFEKRIAIYYAVRNLFSQVSAGNITRKMIVTYTDVVRDAKWFLTDQIHLYLNETIYSNVCRLQEIDEELKGTLAAGEKSRLIQSRREIREWFAAQYGQLDDRFSLYLKFRLQK